MKTIEEIKKEIATEYGEEHFDVLFITEIEVGDLKTAQFLWKRLGDEFIGQYL